MALQQLFPPGCRRLNLWLTPGLIDTIPISNGQKCTGFLVDRGGDGRFGLPDLPDTYIGDGTC